MAHSVNCLSWCLNSVGVTKRGVFSVAAYISLRCVHASMYGFQPGLFPAFLRLDFVLPGAIKLSFEISIATLPLPIATRLDSTALAILSCKGSLSIQRKLPVDCLPVGAQEMTRCSRGRVMAT